MLIKDASYFVRTVPVDKIAHSRAVQSAYTAEAEHKAQETLSKDGELDVTNFQQRLGRAMSGQDLIRVLSRLNPGLIFERSVADPSKFGIYVMKDVQDISTWGWSRERVFVCGMEAALNPEYSIIVPEEEQVVGDKKTKKMKKEIRGWRTVLAKLYKSRLLTEAQIEKEFKISENSGISKHWQEKVGGKIIVAGC